VPGKLAPELDSLADGGKFPHDLHRNKPAMAAVLLWNMAHEMPIDIWSALVQRSDVNYNRNEWMRAHGWNAGRVRCIH